jgi:hypothetical protein
MPPSSPPYNQTTLPTLPSLRKVTVNAGTATSTSGVDKRLSYRLDHLKLNERSNDNCARHAALIRDLLVTINERYRTLTSRTSKTRIAAGSVKDGICVGRGEGSKGYKCDREPPWASLCPRLILPSPHAWCNVCKLDMGLSCRSYSHFQDTYSRLIVCCSHIQSLISSSVPSSTLTRSPIKTCGKTHNPRP